MKIFIFLIIIYVSISVNAYGLSCWNSFLQKPDEHAFTKLKKVILASSQRCSPRIVPTQRLQTQLFKLIRRGNPYAFRAALLMSKCWDGGELEDYYRSVGIFFEVRQHIFAQIIKDETIPDSQLQYMLTMLPLNTVDDIERKISIVNARIRIIQNLDDALFGDIKRRGVYFLEKEKESLEAKRGQVTM